MSLLEKVFFYVFFVFLLTAFIFSNLMLEHKAEQPENACKSIGMSNYKVANGFEFCKDKNNQFHTVDLDCPFIGDCKIYSVTFGDFRVIGDSQ